MSNGASSTGDDLAFSAQEQIDQACDEFEAAWKEGGRPRIEDRLTADQPRPVRLALLRELLNLELFWRKKRDEGGFKSHDGAIAAGLRLLRQQDEAEDARVLDGIRQCIDDMGIGRGRPAGRSLRTSAASSICPQRMTYRIILRRGQRRFAVILLRRDSQQPRFRQAQAPAGPAPNRCRLFRGTTAAIVR
jgi:hypothetical protein